jgi:hypothetical protein
MGGAPEQFTPLPLAVTNSASALPREPLLVESPFRKALAICFRTVAA